MSTKDDPIYSVWRAMLARCEHPQHPSWHRYGGRGITVCAEWQDLEAFRRDMGPRPPGGTLDREKNDLGYTPKNCRWVTHRINCQNTARSKRWTVYGRRFDSLPLASEALGVAQATVLGWCEGYARLGRHYPARQGCFSERA